MIDKFNSNIKYSFLLFVVFGLMSLNNALFAASSNTSLSKLKTKILAPNFHLVDMDGKKIQLKDYKGKPLIINFWATWCPPCREELPSMNKGWKKVKDLGIEMLAINVGEDEDTIFNFTADYPIDFTVLLDLSGNIISEWPVNGLPTTFVIDKEGYIVYRAIGGRDWSSDIMLNKVKALLK